MIGGHFWAPAGTKNMVGTFMTTGVPTSPSIAEQSTIPNVQSPVREVSEVSSRSPKRSHSESEGSDDESVEVKKPKLGDVTASDSDGVALPLRVNPRLRLQIPGSVHGATTVVGEVAQPAASKRKRQDTASPGELASLMKKLKCDGPDPAAAQPKKAKSSWDSFDVKEFDNKSGKLYGSWDFEQLSYSDVKSVKSVACECETCLFAHWMASYSL